jgi:hypothetical protein
VRISNSYTRRDETQISEPSIGKAFNAMFSIYFGNFKEFFVFMLIFQAGMALLSIINTGISLFVPFVGILFSLASIILSILMSGGLIAMAAEAHLKGKTTKSKAFSLIGKKAFAIIIVNIILGISIMIGICLCIIPVYFVLLYLLWSSIIVVVETAEIGDSINRSTAFAKNHSPYLFILAYIGVGIVIALFQFTIIAGPQVLIFIGGLALFGSMSEAAATLILTVASTLITVPVASFFGPFLPIFVTDYYLQTVGKPSEPMFGGKEPRDRRNLKW